MTSGDPSSRNLKYFTNRNLKVPSNSPDPPNDSSSDSTAGSTIQPSQNTSFINRLLSFRQSWAHTRCVANTAWCLKNGIKIVE